MYLNFCATTTYWRFQGIDYKDEDDWKGYALL